MFTIHVLERESTLPPLVSLRAVHRGGPRARVFTEPPSTVTDPRRTGDGAGREQVLEGFQWEVGVFDLYIKSDTSFLEQLLVFFRVSLFETTGLIFVWEQTHHLILVGVETRGSRMQINTDGN